MFQQRRNDKVSHWDKLSQQLLSGPEPLVAIGSVVAHCVAHSVESGTIIPSQRPQPLRLGIRIAPLGLEGPDPFLLLAVLLFCAPFGRATLRAGSLLAPVFQRCIEAETRDWPVWLEPG